ncbi:MAG: hypothetical protein IJT59_04335 [Desulfovibrionaceae bacterium]|nr:hypothetical protein [Desulfovibrionaceae bacterium]
MVNWVYRGDVVNSLDDIARLTGRPAQSVFGFVYELYFKGDLAYIGKKNLWTAKELEPLKSGAVRQGHIKFVKHIKDGHKVSYEITRKESDWLNYVGSSKEVEGLIPVSRTILELCFSKRQLTYKEVWWQFKLDVLVNTQYLNGNILNKFFRNNLI